MWSVAAILFLLILFVGVSLLRGLSGTRPVERLEPVVADADEAEALGVREGVKSWPHMCHPSASGSWTL